MSVSDPSNLSCLVTFITPSLLLSSNVSRKRNQSKHTKMKSFASSLALLTLAAPAFSDLTCSHLVLAHFEGKHTAYLNIAGVGNIQAHYPVNLAVGNETGTALFLDSCTSESLGVGYSCGEWCSWTGARIRNPATGHCLTVRNRDPPVHDMFDQHSDLDFRVCDPNPGPSNATQLFEIDAYDYTDDAGNIQSTSYTVFPAPPYKYSVNGFRCWDLAKDGVTVRAQFGVYCEDLGAYLSPGEK